MKKFAAFLTAFMTLMSMAACSDTANDSGLSAENDVSTTTSATETAVSDEEEEIVELQAEAIWAERGEEEMYGECDVIADVTINSLEEIAISYTCMGTECTSYHTLASVSVNKVYYPAEENVIREFVVSLPVSSHTPYEDFPETKTGESCIVFISSTAGLDDSIELHNYTDYWLGHPADIININGTECTADNIFFDYSDSSVPVTKGADIELLEGEELVDGAELNEIPTGRCSMPLIDFENTLAEKIDEKIMR